MEPTTQPTLLTSSQFDAYSAAWRTLVTEDDAARLRDLFQQDSRLVAAHLPLARVAQLVSAPGGRYLRVGFVVQPEAPEGESAFALALYATDAKGKRLSAYYLARAPWSLQVAGSFSGPSDACRGMQVPAWLADGWQRRWAEAATAEPGFFKVADEALRGYDFTISDFLGALLAVEQADDRWLTLEFGLHEFYGPDALEAAGPTHAFGLALRVTTGQGEPQSMRYDMAIPNPPGLGD